MIRGWLASALALIGIATSATPAAALLLWTLTATPLTVTAGVATTFSLTATNLDLLTELGCLEVDLPASFDIVGASAGNASNGDEWEAVVFPNKVAVHSLSGGGRLELGQTVSFTITAVPSQAGTWAWTNHAHRPQDCSGTDEIGTPIAILVVPGATPTPEPTPPPTPTPTPTPILSIGPLPTLPPILPLPTVPLATPRPATPTPVPTGAPTPAATSPTPSATPVVTPASDDDGGSIGGTSPTPPAPSLGSGGSASVVLRVGEPEAPEGSVGEVSLGPLGVIDGITVWAIPGAIVGGPGLLVILWVLFQTGVALAWIPAVLRLRGSDRSTPNLPNGQAA